jgi:tetratricopeptide (TPR) repeat protein
LRRGLDVPVGHIFVRTVLGYELLNLGRLDESAAEFTKVLEYQPDHPAALNNLASIYLMTGRYLDCIPLYQRLLATQPDAGTASNLGTAFFYLDRLPEAIQAYERANEMDPHSPEYERNLADAHDLAGATQESRRWYEAALADCERLAREGKAAPGTRLLRAVLLGRVGKTAEALREADAFARESPKDMFAIYAAAQIHAMAGLRKETFELTRTAIALGYPREEFRRDPYFGALREDREFLDLLVK